jgi:ABC-type polysaccharide/polyol phosphate transport system ATPase subunit
MNDAASPRPALEVAGLGETYRPKSRRGWRRRGQPRWALRDVTFDLAPGEALGVIGANGSGKSTLLLCLAGVLQPSEGSCSAAGRVASLIDLGAGLHRELTGRENMIVAAVLAGLSRRDAIARLPSMIAFSGLDPDAIDSPLRTYSVGMGLRLAFAVVANCAPAVLLVDEVLAVGDDAFQARCRDRVRELRSTGTGVVLVSHDLRLVAEECDRVALLEAGRVVRLGEPRSVIDLYRGSDRFGTGVTPPADAPLFTSAPPQRRPGV